ncbi:hypothetical protein EKL30_18460 [Candidimonas sp. SYP-B2681]|nr:hypothetical protein EKL30_18460 [Candidimonas sp. SYP-B2681]
MRHEAVSRLVDAGLSDQQVPPVCGHKSMQMLKRYTHIEAKNSVAKLDKLRSRCPTNCMLFPRLIHHLGLRQHAHLPIQESHRHIVAPKIRCMQEAPPTPFLRAGSTSRHGQYHFASLPNRPSVTSQVWNMRPY